MRVIFPKRLMESVFPTVRNGGIFNTSSLDLQFARTKTLDPRITFTRASSGTYVGSDGVIKTATTNLLLRSEEFDNASWIKLAATVNANAETSPFGSLAADKLVETTAASSYHYILQTCSYAPQTTFSIFAKKGERSVLRLQTGGDNYGADFNLNTGATGNLNNVASVSMVSVGNGWYRCSITTSNTVALNGILIILNSAGFNTPVYTGDGTSGIYLWGAQLEQSSTVGEYIPTTSTINSAPRFDHNPTTGESLGLLVEEQRTNLLTASEAMHTSPWGLAAATAVANDGVAPDGTTTADKVISTGGGVFRAGVGVANSTAYTYSVFLKHVAGTGVVSAVGFERFGSTPLAGTSSFNLLTGAIVNGAAVQSSSITRYPNNWYRVSVTATSTDVTTTVVNYAAASGNEFLIWGAQLETGAFPTSYIPTTTATVTRSADVASITGANFSSWYRQDEGTVFAETQFPAGTAVNTSSRTVLDITDGTTNNRLNIRAIGVATTTDQLTVRSGAATSAQFGSNGSAVSTAFRKLACAVKVDDFASWATGATTAATDTSGAMPVAVSQASLGSSFAGTEVMAGTIRRLTYWPSRLPNSTLQEITR